jgi:membrane protease YdiL (CAAX protease family)
VPTRPTAKKATPSPVASEPEEVLPRDGAQYPQILRNDSYLWWRSLMGAAFGLSLFLLLTTVVSQAVVAIFWVLTARSTPYASYFTSAFAFERPSGMLGANLGIATLIPIAWGLMAVIHRVRPRWLSSVQPRIRWKYLLICLGVAAVALNGVLLLSILYSPMPAVGAQRGFWGFLVVILLTSPLQAAAEEIFFRGYLMQALGSLWSQPWFGVVVSSVVFALFHGTQNLPLFLDRLVFGLLAALLVWRTGGLEAGIAAHVINNICAYLFAGLTTSIATIRAVREIGWADAAFDVGGFALFALLAYLVARAMKLRTRVELTSPGWGNARLAGDRV